MSTFLLLYYPHYIHKIKEEIGLEYRIDFKHAVEYHFKWFDNSNLFGEISLLLPRTAPISGKSI